MEKIDLPETSAFDEQPVTNDGGALLVVDNMSFSFPGMTGSVLKGVSFVLEPGALLAVTGPIGGGKSALVSALSGLYPYEGSIKVDGVELRDLPPAQRAAFISTVDQGALLFSGTVTENITLFSQDTRMDSVASAAAASAVDTDVAGFPKGYDTQVGESGVRVSGGQRQRIALARAVYRNTPLLVLDDPFSAVDLITERQILRGLRQEQGKRTIVLCSHRLNAFETADWVLVLDNGAIVEQGTHQSLLREDGLYARIYRAQGVLGVEGA